MKAAVYYGPDAPWPQKLMAIEEGPTPTPGPGEVLIKVAACGLCRTDLEYLKGEGVTPKRPPIILGHEPSGTVAEVGAGVDGVIRGQKVLVATPIPCRNCHWCCIGQENLCHNMVIVGATQDGAFAEYVISPAGGVYSLPDGLPLEESCIITDAVGSSYHALYNRAKVKPQDTVAIYGASGGLGLICVQLAAAVGAKVIAIGRKKWKLDKAKELGATEIISVVEVDHVEKVIRRMTGGGVDISVDVTGAPYMIESAFLATKPGGTLVVAGFSFHKIQLNINHLNWFERNVIGSKNYCAADMPEILKLVKQGVINLDKVVSHRFRLEEINNAYQMLDRGEILRGVIIP